MAATLVVAAVVSSSVPDCVASADAANVSISGRVLRPSVVMASPDDCCRDAVVRLVFAHDLDHVPPLLLRPRPSEADEKLTTVGRLSGPNGPPWSGCEWVGPGWGDDPAEVWVGRDRCCWGGDYSSMTRIPWPERSMQRCYHGLKKRVSPTHLLLAGPTRTPRTDVVTLADERGWSPPAHRRLG